MEGHDVFTQRNEIGDEDPFAGSDFGDWEQQEPEAPAEPQQQTPVEPSRDETRLIENPNIESGYDGPVAAEGEVSPNHPAHPQWHEGQQVQITDAPQEPPPVLEPPPPPPSPSQAAQEDAQSPDVASAPPSPPPPAAPPAPVAPSEPAAGVGGPSETAPTAAQEAPDAAPTPSPEVQHPPEPQNGSESVAEAAGREAARREEEGDVPIDTAGLPEPTPPAPPAVDGAEPEADAPIPEETKDKRGRVTHRRYVILRHEGAGRFTQLDWYEDKQRKPVSKNTPGSKRQTVVLARGTEDALKFGYVVAGSPSKGVPLVAVAAAYFQVKNVAPQPPEPMKQRLQIT